MYSFYFAKQKKKSILTSFVKHISLIIYILYDNQNSIYPFVTIYV